MIESNDLKNDQSYYEEIDYDNDNSVDNRNDLIEVIEERPSEEDYTSMKKCNRRQYV